MTGPFHPCRKPLPSRQKPSPARIWWCKHWTLVTDKPIVQPASCDLLLQQVQTLSETVGHDFTGVVLSDSDTGSLLNTKVLDCTDVINDVGFVTTPLSEFLQSTDLADQRLLLHPACCDLYACLEHYVAHKKASTSAVIVMPKQPGMWRKYVRTAQLLRDSPCSDALFAPCDDEALGKHAVQVYYDSPVATDSVCAVIGSLGLTMQFQGSISGVPTS